MQQVRTFMGLRNLRSSPVKNWLTFVFKIDLTLTLGRFEIKTRDGRTLSDTICMLQNLFLYLSDI